jgi:hypothetical protein
MEELLSVSSSSEAPHDPRPTTVHDISTLVLIARRNLGCCGGRVTCGHQQMIESGAVRAAGGGESPSPGADVYYARPVYRMKVERETTIGAINRRW